MKFSAYSLFRSGHWVAVRRPIGTSHLVGESSQEREICPYTGQQQDWPARTSVAPIEVAKDGIPIYDQLPDRPYEVLGTVFASDDCS